MYENALKITLNAMCRKKNRIKWLTLCLHCLQPYISLYMSLGEANRQKVKLAKMALNHLQEPRDIKIRQCKHKVSHFIQFFFLRIRVIFEAFSYIVS